MRRRDAVVIGGGHNGLVAAAYLARSGAGRPGVRAPGRARRCRRQRAPVRPDYTVTSLSYVVSLLPPDLVRDLRLEQHGYQRLPAGALLRAARPTGAPLWLPADPVARHAEIARFCRADADAYGDYEAHLAQMGRLLGPLLHQIPAAPRLAAASRPLAAGRLLAQLRGAGVRESVDLTRLLTGSIATCSTVTSKATRYGACCRSRASSAPGPDRGRRERRYVMLHTTSGG